MHLYIGCDHAGLTLKRHLIDTLDFGNLEWFDLGVHSSDAKLNYPDIAEILAEKLKDTNEKGILICGSGIGMSIAANRFSHIRAALCRNSIDAMLARLHNDANVLCLGERITSEQNAMQIVNAFIQTEFEGGRHTERVEKLSKIKHS